MAGEIGKALNVCGRLRNIWKSKNISLDIKAKLYHSHVLSTMLQCTCPLSTVPKKNLEAASVSEHAPRHYFER